VVANVRFSHVRWHSVQQHVLARLLFQRRRIVSGPPTRAPAPACTRAIAAVMSLPRRRSVALLIAVAISGPIVFPWRGSSAVWHRPILAVGLSHGGPRR
jgi:hypothetical protein